MIDQKLESEILAEAGAKVYCAAYVEIAAHALVNGEGVLDARKANLKVVGALMAAIASAAAQICEDSPPSEAAQFFTNIGETTRRGAIDEYTEVMLKKKSGVKS